MSHYSGKLIIYNETENKFITHKDNLLVSFKFSVRFNNEKLFLNNTILRQLLDSQAVQKYIIKDINKYFNENKKVIEDKIKTCLILDKEPKIVIKVIGKYFFVYVYGTLLATIDEHIKCIEKKIKNEKTRLEILKG